MANDMDEGLLVRKAAASNEYVLFELQTGAGYEVPENVVTDAGLDVPSDGALSVNWLSVDDEWLLEATGRVVECRWYRWSDNPQLLGRKVDGKNLLLQHRDGQQRTPVAVSSLNVHDVHEHETTTWREVLTELRCDLLHVVSGVPSGPSVFVIPAPGERPGDVEARRQRAFDDIGVRQADADREAATVRTARQRERVHNASIDYAVQSSAPDIFVNPYNFVPLPASVPRQAPCGHHRRFSDRRSGRVEVTWIARSPLLFGDGMTQGLEADPDGTYRVSGTSLKGSLRSLHETITGSCLRVFDPDFLPVYRQPAAVQTRRTLGVVSRVDALGRPSAVRLCADVLWIDVAHLHAVRPASELRTGDLFEIKGLAAKVRHSRSEFERGEVSFSGSMTASDHPTRPDQWVVLLAGRLTGSRHPYFAALGRLPGREAPVGAEVSARWSIEVDGAEDLRKQRNASATGDWVQVKYGTAQIGRRRSVPEMPGVGYVLWADVENDKVERFAASYLWRRQGSGATGERVPAEALGCTDDEDLCLSCRSFGSAGSDEKDARRGARQRSYRGQVRVSELKIDVSGSGLVEQPLPPRGQPRPSAGQFSLQIRETAPITDNAELHAAAWGSRRETTPLRQIRGRKFYWHGHTEDTVGGWRRDVARAHQAQRTMGSANVRVVPTGSTVRATVWFENLTDPELGALIASLDPTRLLDPERQQLQWRRVDEDTERRPRLWTHLGGGKGLGFGSVEIDTFSVTVDSNDRYRGAASDQLPDDQIVVMVDAYRSAEHTRLAATWKELAAMLDPDRVDPQRIAYPPAQSWSELEAGGPSIHQKFDESFKFFKHSRGGGSGAGSSDVIALPRPSDPEPWLGVVTT